VALAVAILAARAAAQPLELDPLKDGILLGVGLPYAAITEVLAHNLDRDVLGAPDRDDINAFDRLAMAGYSKGLDTAADILVAAAMLTPASYALFLDSRDLLTAAVIYAETLAFAEGAKNTFKLLVARYRPYVYEGGASGVDSSEDDVSFVSGHATMAFAAATASVLLFRAYFPGSRWLVPLAAGAYGLATLTAALRVAAGMHFVTDTVAGAALGTGIGVVVPLLHRSRGDEEAGGLKLSALPGGVLLTWRY
jgi:undecaprenyl-diphosphatase